MWRSVGPFLDALEQAHVPWFVGGSAASSALGEPRSTNDIDVVISTDEAQAESLAVAVESEYVVDVDSVRRAVRRGSSFQLVHEPTVFKIDVFVPRLEGFAASRMARRVKIDVPEAGRAVYLSSAEDMVLQKLVWYRSGGCVSERQWEDVAGLLAAQPDLDVAYMRTWASRLGIPDLLEKALAARR